MEPWRQTRRRVSLVAVVMDGEEFEWGKVMILGGGGRVVDCSGGRWSSCGDGGGRRWLSCGDGGGWSVR